MLIVVRGALLRRTDRPGATMKPCRTQSTSEKRSTRAERPRTRSGPRRLALLAAIALTGPACADDGPSEPTGPAPSLEVLGVGAVTGRLTTDLWVHGDVAYTGTRSAGAPTPLYVWDVRSVTNPVLVDSVVVDAVRANDVKIRADGTLAVVTHEGSSDGLNGITLLDLTDPLAPEVVSRYTANLERGVHNVWIEGDFVYVVQNGPAGVGALRIVDISDPSAPIEVASMIEPDAFPHDVLVRDGLAFVSFWDAGLVILDVGNGIEGGSPQAPVEVSRIDLDGQTHNAWYWPAGDVVFVGEEDFGTGTRAPGIVHVVEVSDLQAPVEVATFETVTNVTPPHNFWLDEGAGILYVGWYAEGLVALDVTGTLQGRLDEDGARVLGQVRPFGSGQCGSGLGSCVWAPQLHGGVLFTSDVNQGLVIHEVF